MDILGPFPPAFAQRKFIFIATEYYTKCIEVEAISSIIDNATKKFLLMNIVYRFRIPRVLITDNGPNSKVELSSMLGTPY